MHWAWWILIFTAILALGLGLGLGLGLKTKKAPSSSKASQSLNPGKSTEITCNACTGDKCITITNLVTPSETCNASAITIFAMDNDCGSVANIDYGKSIVLPLSAVTQWGPIAFGVQENSWYWVEGMNKPSSGSDRQNPDNCGADISVADDGTVTVNPGVQIEGTPDGSKVLTATGSKSGSAYHVTFFRKDNQTLFPTKDCCSPENVGGTCLSKGINPYENSDKS